MSAWAVLAVGPLSISCVLSDYMLVFKTVISMVAVFTFLLSSLSLSHSSSLSFSETVSSFTGSLQSALKHYSSWKNLRELFIIPHKHITHPNKKSGGGNSKAKTSTSTKTQKTQNDANLNPTSGGGGSSKSDVKESNKAPKVVNSSPPVNEGTSPAIEVENYMMTHVYFAQSEEPRVPKPTHVSYSVGQVVYHTQGGYWGVIVGWDKVAKVSPQRGYQQI